MRAIMRKKGISQADILKKCAENNCSISQATLSKILQGSRTISLINAVQICKVLNEDIADVLAMDETTIIDKNDVSKDIPSQLIYRADNPVFRAYLGIYHCYFYSTISSEDMILHGILELKSSMSGNRCIAEMNLEIGKLDSNGEPIKKYYEGEAVISTSMNAVYCTLVSKKMSEMCFFLFRYNQINFGELLCRLAVAITVSAGDNRLPTAHRMLLSREELGDILDNYLAGHLLLNDSEILIKAENLEKLKEDPMLPPWFKDNIDSFVSDKSVVNYVRAQELIVRASLAPKEEKNKFICLLRKYSSAPKYTKIAKKADGFVFQLIEDFQKECSQQKE